MNSALSKNKVLAVIPARGGSKGLPGKNLRPLHGKPLLHHSVEHALQAPCVSTVVVSTDDPHIAESGVLAGAQVPFIALQNFPEILHHPSMFYSIAWTGTKRRANLLILLP